jgi:importin subunit beta-1
MSLAQLIQDTESTNNEKRKIAEEQLLEARNQNPSLFILACSQEFSQNNLTDLLRPKAGILIKYTLINFPDGADKLWASFDDDTRQQTKTNILGTLAYPNDPIRNVAADLISIICAIEFPFNGWPDLIPSLTQNTNNKDPAIKKSAILALGKLCDQFKIKKITLNKDIVNEILVGIYYGMQANETDDIKLIAVKALTDSLIFVKELFDNQSVRQEVVKLLLGSMASNNRGVKISAFQCLIEFVKIYYDYLREFYVPVWEATSTAIIGNDKELAILAIEVWNVIANEDKERANSDGRGNAFQKQASNIIMEVDKVLVPALLQNLLDASKYDDSDEGGELNIISSTRSCLISIAETMKDGFLEYAIKFVGTYLLSQNLLELRAGLITYSCMLDGPSPKSLAQLVTQALPTITEILVKSNNLILQEEASVALERTAEIIPQAYFQEPLFSNINEGLTAAIQAHPRISLHITKLWHNLGEDIVKKINQNKEFPLDFSIVIDQLINNAFRDLDKEYYILIDHSLLAVMTLLLCTSKEETRGKYVHALVEQFKKTGNVGGERRELIQAGLLACLQTLLHKYQFKTQDPVADEIFNLINDMFQAYNDVTADGIYVLGALASSLGTDFRPYSEKAWICIAEGFKKYDQPELFVATLSAIVEMASACPEQTKNYLGDIFKTLVTLIDEKTYDKSLKLRIIMSIGDIALGCKDLILPYVETLTRMYEVAMNAATHIPTQEASDMVDYLEQLRENVLDSYVCFFHAVTESENPDLIFPSIPTIMQYLAVTCTKDFNPTVDYMRNALAFVADVGLIFKDRAAQFVKSDLTANLIDILSKFLNNPDNAAILDYAKKVINQL